jgi:hypothetical protein
MATVAAAYTIAPFERTPESIIGEEHCTGPPPRPEQKRVWAKIEKSPKEFIEET